MAESLEFFNGHGGFDPVDGEYVIRVPGGGSGAGVAAAPGSTAGVRRSAAPGREVRAETAPSSSTSATPSPAATGTTTNLPTPRPWINVIANENFGFLISETGAGSTWHRNSREHRLTPWHNDPLLDPHGEAIYIRDDETMEFWSPFAGPAPAGGDYEVRHGFGRTRCRHRSRRLEEEVETFVPLFDPVRLTTLRLTNITDRERQFSIFTHYRLVLGGLPPDETSTGPGIVTAGRPGSPRITATNPASQFPDGVAFVDFVPDPAMPGVVHASGDRKAFIGADGTVRRPAAVAQQKILDGRFGGDLDACFAQQVVIRLAPGATFAGSFLLGEGDDAAQAQNLCEKYAAPGAITAARDEALRFWSRLRDGVRIATPSRAIDLMVNGWLPYQTLACRLWARSALYQSGGAFGFRDQLQDAASLVHVAPEVTRAQILLHAAHQFVEGDVLHWWHPPFDRGIRTRFADDLLWLPGVTASYIGTTGDWQVLNEPARFLSARQLAPGEDETYLEPVDSGESADLYEHCVRALDRSLAVGNHGLPLFGTGDWNDGMNRVGREGKGESVWMGFFLYDVLGRFLPACEHRDDRKRIARYAAHRLSLAAALNLRGWDGEWYRRGYYDDGTPLGSSKSDECRIDALAQAWSVISGVAPRERAEMAMAAVERELVSEERRLIRLLTPPFENSAHDPGYIKGYVPGVRENGGQYTHAALWVVMAMGRLGRNDRVARWLEMLTPIAHTSTPADVARYEAEPYVVAADVYGVAPHEGRAGWTWYTGSSGWMYRVAIETLLGFSVVEGAEIHLKPCIPADWPACTIHYRLPGSDTRYEIRIANPMKQCAGAIAASVDGSPCEIHEGTARIPLKRDSGVHKVDVTVG